MASFTPTYTYANLISLADNMVAGVSTSGIDVTACDVLASIFWCYGYPWRWAIKNFTAIALADNAQDFACTDTDIFQPLSGRIVRTDVTPNQTKDVGFMRWMEPDTQMKVAFPNFGTVAYLQVADANKIRMPATLTIPSGQTLQFQGEYKKNPAKVTSTGATVPFPDHYAHVFISGLIWYYYKFTRDKRQGSLELLKGSPIYTGALGEFYDALRWCAEQEDFGKADTRFPDEPLGASAGSTYVTGMFGPF